MTVDEAEAAEAVEETGATEEAGDPREDGRTRCSWVRGRPEHYFFHDAEYGRLPDSDPPVFELVLLACFMRDTELGDLLDHRGDIYEAFAEWNMEAAAEASDEDLDALTARGGIFEDRERLAWIRDVAKECVETRDHYKPKHVREYFLALVSLDAEQTLTELQERFPGFTKQDGANLLQLIGSVHGCSHERDCWIA